MASEQGDEMADKSFAEALNDQIPVEFGAHQQYIAIAVWFESETLPQLAGFYYRQAVEERNHAMMITQYLLDRDLEVTVPGVGAPKTSFSGIAEPVRLGLEQEKQVTVNFNEIAAAARADGDFQGEQFVQWFLNEQVEEVSTASDLLTTVEREKSAREIEEYAARELAAAQDADPLAPGAAGGAL
ncbi:MAG: ferritin [Solirubrobacterales bacterium]